MDLREIDAKVAEHIFGYKREIIPPDANGENECKILVPPNLPSDLMYPPKGKLAFTYHVPRYSSDIKAAFEVVEKLSAEWKWFELVYSPSKIYTANFTGVMKDSKIADTAPLAICLAALEVVGVDGDSSG